MGTGDWIPRAAFSHLKGELPKDFRLRPISILGGQCFQTARVMLFPHTVWVREAATLCRSQMYPQHKEQGTEPWKLNLLVVKGGRCFFSHAGSGLPALCRMEFSLIPVWLPLLTFQVSAQMSLPQTLILSPCLQEPPPYQTDRSLALKLFPLQYLRLFIVLL